MSLGFTKSKEDSNLYFNIEGRRLVMLLLYVDDLFLIGEEELIKDARSRLATEFDMEDLGMMHYFLGMELWQIEGVIFLGKGKYAMEILKRFKMLECKAMATPMASNLKLLSDASSKKVNATIYCQMITLLMYLTKTRLDICFAVNTLSQFLTDLRQVHIDSGKACFELGLYHE